MVVWKGKKQLWKFLHIDIFRIHFSKLTIKALSLKMRRNGNFFMQILDFLAKLNCIQIQKFLIKFKVLCENPVFPFHHST